MAWADFAEREYELAVAIELATGVGGHPPLFTAGQVLERVLGYDAVADPAGTHLIWRLLELPRPRGVRLVPGLWDPGLRPPRNVLPRTPVSLVLQFKRPEHLRGSRARQWAYWRAPYFRFTLREHQQRVLRHLERNLRQDAIVRYAAPAFWRRGEFEAAHLAREVTARSGFVPPAQLVSHTVWTYQQPGILGRANRRTRRGEFEPFEALFRGYEPVGRAGTDLVPSREPLEEHLRRLGAVARRRQPDVRRGVEAWGETVLRADIALSREGFSLLMDITAFSSLVARAQASWFVVDRSEPPLGPAA